MILDDEKRKSDEQRKYREARTIAALKQVDRRAHFPRPRRGRLCKIHVLHCVEDPRAPGDATSVRLRSTIHLRALRYTWRVPQLGCAKRPWHWAESGRCRTLRCNEASDRTVILSTARLRGILKRMLDLNGGTGVVVFGLGYVGCVMSACLAHLGHRLTGLDGGEFRGCTVLDQYAPLYETGLAEIVDKVNGQSMLRATALSACSLYSAAIVVICAGIPSARNDLAAGRIDRVVADIGQSLPMRTFALTVPMRSAASCDSIVLRSSDAPAVRALTRQYFRPSN
jgi:hypothetical protein